jgi:hypothetical protein
MGTHGAVSLALVAHLAAFLGTATALASGPPPVEGAASRTVTLADNGQLLDLGVGDRLLLTLGGEYDWTVRVADPTVVSRVANAAVPSGAQGLYEATRPGETALEAVGEPPCRKAQPPCAAPSRLFRLQLRVLAAPPIPGLPNTGGGRGSGVGTGATPGGLPAVLLVVLALGLLTVRRAARRRSG